MTYESKDKIVS